MKRWCLAVLLSGLLSGCAGTIEQTGERVSEQIDAMFQAPVFVTVSNGAGDSIRHEDLPLTMRLDPGSQWQEGQYDIRIGSEDDPIATLELVRDGGQWLLDDYEIPRGFTRWLIVDSVEEELWWLPPEQIHAHFAERSSYTHLIISDKKQLAEEHYDALVPFSFW